METKTDTALKKTSQTPVKVYFENLNAIRFIAAFLVIIHHTEQYKKPFYIATDWDLPAVRVIGNLGVVLFFVLSGFLISYLLFKEQEITNTISIKDFYIRRVLRIWPLYFFIIFLAFFVLPFIDLFSIPGITREMVWSDLPVKLLMYVFFLPNLVLNVFGMIPFVSQTWSIGAEEQFYLIWPVLNKKIKNKWLLMISVIIIYLIIKFTFKYFIPQTEFVKIFTGYWSTTPIDCMAIGGLFALTVFETNPFTAFVKKILFKKWLQWTVLVALIILISQGFYFPYFHYEFYAVLFGILIFNFSSNKNRIFSMEYPWLNYLGKVSYGLYMYHLIAIVFSIKIALMVNLTNNFFLYPLILLTVISLSSLSYEFFEKKFINKKIKYSKLVSGDSVMRNTDNADLTDVR